MYYTEKVLEDFTKPAEAENQLHAVHAVGHAVDSNMWQDGYCIRKLLGSIYSAIVQLAGEYMKPYTYLLGKVGVWLQSWD